MKSVMLASQTLQLASSGSKPALGYAVLAGGMESMSNAPHYLMGSRDGFPLGNASLVDGVIHDGLWDPYNDQHMGLCGEKCASDYSITRAEQDEYAINSYKRAQEASKANVFDEIVPVHVPQRRGDPLKIDTDEELTAVKVEKIPMLKPAFDKKTGTITAANASSLNDGACAMVLMTEDDALDRGIKPLARIVGYGDAEQDPVDFTTTPSLAVNAALSNAGMALTDIEYHEINEAFSVVRCFYALCSSLSLSFCLPHSLSPSS
jgi:acetyl-CoA C-acetyltransferase